MSNQNVFEVASRKAFHFTSNKGELTTEQLWSLPLSAANQFDLNNVAIALNNSLKGFEESFVAVKATPGKADLETKLEIVKYIISVRQEEAAKRAEAAEKAAKREKLLQALANKQDEAVKAMSQEDILKQLAELEG